MREYVCTEFCSFAQKTTMENCAVLLDIRQIDGNANFKNVFFNCADCKKSLYYYESN